MVAPEGGDIVPVRAHIGDMCHAEKQSVEDRYYGLSEDLVAQDAHHSEINIVVSDGESLNRQNGAIPTTMINFTTAGQTAGVESPKKPHLSRNPSSQEQCRVCQQEMEEDLINLGCHCRGGLARAHQSCISTWFNSRGSNKCEICQQVAANVVLPESQASVLHMNNLEGVCNLAGFEANLGQANYWVWRVDSAYRGMRIGQEHERGCFSPIWIAFSILIGGLLLDVLISISLGVSALPVNIIIGVIIVLGLGTALRLALEFCNEWRVRRVVHRVEANASLGYHPAL